MRLSGLLFLLIIFAACGSQDSLPGYYDVNEMVFDLSIELGSEERAVEKFAILDGDSTFLKLDLYESTALDNAMERLWGINPAQAQWFSELNVMKEINPNQPKYRNKFEISEDTTEQGYKSLKYVAKSPKTDLQEFYIEEDEGDLVFLSAKLKHKNILASNYREYRLEPYSQLEVQGRQDIILLPKKNFAVRIQY